MGTLIILGIIFAGIAAYLSLGVVVGLHRIPRQLALERKRYPALYDPAWGQHVTQAERDAKVADAHRSAVGDMLFALPIWPVLLVCQVVEDQLVRKVADHDPIAQERKIAQQARRIAELERELNI